MANLKTICAFLRISILLLQAFDKERKATMLVELLQEVQAKLCDGNLFADMPSEVDLDRELDRETFATQIAEAIRDACDCDDCEG